MSMKDAEHLRILDRSQILPEMHVAEKTKMGHELTETHIGSKLTHVPQ